MKIAVITDSASNLYKELLDEYDIDMVTLNYENNGKIYPCYNPKKSYEEQGHEFYEKLRQGERMKTSLPSPQQFIECFKKHIEKGEEILFFSISAKLSGTLNSALTAKELLLEDYPNAKIECQDSMSASFGEAMVAIHASKLVKQGKTMEEILAEVLPTRLFIRNEFTVDNLSYLQKGGRISKLISMIGNFLEIKPLLRASREADIEMVAKARGRKKALMLLCDTIKNSITSPEEQTLYLAHCDCLDDVNKLIEQIKKEIPNLKNIVVSMYDFCTGAHVGPGTIAAFYYGTKRPLND